MADYTPVYDAESPPMSKTASAAVVGGTLVEATTASSVGPAGAASNKVLGVAAFDAAIGARVSVWPLVNLEHEVVAAGTIAVGDGIQAAAAGQIVTAATSLATAAAAGILLGIATTAGTAAQKVRFVGRN